MRRRSGFTLIELLIVVVIIGILAAIAIPKFQNTKGKSYTAAIKSDLRNVATAQEAYFYENSTYATATSMLNLRSSPGVTIDIVGATASGWSATAWHIAASPIECGLFMGNQTALSGATVEGVIGCVNQ
jgi:prepilin-type N-terminal cleavage/methylation domain-containing protein